MLYRSSLLPGVPLIESPLFEAELDHMQLNHTERLVAKALHRDGFAIIEFPDAEIDARIERIRTRLAPELGVVDDRTPNTIKTGGKGRIQDAWERDEDVRAIAANAQVIDLLSRLYGRRAFPFQTLNFPVGTQQHPHTDTVHFSSLPERFMCGVWLAMEDIDPDAGPLCYFRGSHRWPIVSNAMIGRKGWGEEGSAQAPYHDVWNAMAAAHGIEAEQFSARRGQALIWTANLLHGGSRQTDQTKTRWSQVTHYFFDDCLYYTPAFSDEALGRLALRKIVDAADGRPKPNTYLGEEIRPQETLGMPVWRRTKRAIRRAFD